ncbi:hypothetical protein [Krasilnikovia sp. M28-CT-15]|uniref:hypothetical protein n=1 Tax=Krasilnikovia sp. M28-CT-15 TaxID=3373540 RepID=UPI0038778976
MPSAKSLLLLIGAALIAVVGGLLGSPWATGVGVVFALGVLGVFPPVTASAVPRVTRWLLWGGLLLLAAAVVVKVGGWWNSPFRDGSLTEGELVTLLGDRARQRTQFVRALAVLGFQVLACGCFGVAVALVPRDRLRGQKVGPLVIVGATALAAATLRAADSAWRSVPDPPPDSHTFTMTGVLVRIDTGPDIESAVAVGALLLGAALIVLTCARLSMVDDVPP